MQNASRIDWWKLRRVRWPLGTLLVLGVSAGMAIFRSQASRVVVYNETGGSITELAVSACGQSQLFNEVGERESVHLILTGTGGESDIAITTNGVALWRGDYLEAGGGYRATVRLRRDGQVESSTTRSWWQGLLDHPAASIP